MPVRIATPDDAAAIAEVQTGTWRIAYRGIMPDALLDGLSVDDSAARWRTRLAEPGHGTFVAEIDGTVVGFATAGSSRDTDAPVGTGELLAIYVSPPAWGRGRGRTLWDAARKALIADGFDEATLWVLEQNRRARAFYERLGFTLEPSSAKVVKRDGAPLTHLRYRIRLP